VATADLIAFFLLRRNLDDLVDRLGGVLAGDQPDEQARADLEGCGGACRAGTRWRHASSTPACCWRGGSDPAGDGQPGLVFGSVRQPWILSPFNNTLRKVTEAGGLRAAARRCRGQEVDSR
jgi:hypothetical protein